MISKQLLTELKEILEQDYNLKPTLEEITEIGSTLLRYFETLIEIKSKTNLEMKGGGLK